tara:strand:- start:2950 stop:3381 length:432 start_codon:yes stop_codon:yes gene_type:complete
MKTKIKDLFKTSSQNTADFFTSNYMEEQMPKTTMETKQEEISKAKLPKKGILGRIKDAFKGAGEDQYENRVQTYNQYLKTLNSYKTDKVSLSGKVGISLMSPKSAKSVGRVSMTNYEQKLAEWNRRMREFSIRRYYASLGKRK